jgi:hypothetical protein
MKQKITTKYAFTFLSYRLGVLPNIYPKIRLNVLVKLVKLSLNDKSPFPDHLKVKNTIDIEKIIIIIDATFNETFS